MFEITPISIITQIDRASEAELEMFLNNYKQFVKLFSKKKIPLIMKNEEEVSIFSRNLNENIHPIFLCSSKTGFGIELIFTLLKNLNFVDNKYINNLIQSPYNNKKNALFNYVNYTNPSIYHKSNSIKEN